MMRLVLLILCLLLLLPVLQSVHSSSTNHVNKNLNKDEDEDDDDDDVNVSDDDDEGLFDDYDEEEEDKKEEQQSKNATKRLRPHMTPSKSNRRQGVRRMPINIRTWSLRPSPPVAVRPQQPILLLNMPVPAPVYVNPAMRQNPVYNISYPAGAPAVTSPFAAANRNININPLNPATVVINGGGGGFSVSGVKSVVQSANLISPPPPRQSEFIIQPQVSQGILPNLQTPQVTVQTIRAPVYSDQVLQSIPMTTHIPLTPSPLVAPPAPPPSYYTSALADEIHCVRQPGKTSLTALLTAPPGYTALPFLSARPDIDAQTSSTCRIIPTAGAHVYRLELFNFPDCGVSSQQEPDGKEWLSVSIRFPLVSGLKTPDDEVITIKCKPQDRTASANHAVDFHGNLVSSPAASRSSVFLGQENDLQCDLALFRASAGSFDYSHRVNAGSAIELGQELQLRALIKPGDGWNYVKLSDVIVYRVPSSFDANSKVQLLEASRKHMVKGQQGLKPDATVEFAHLVLGDGCRNPSYKAIAPNHPVADPSNSLEVAFNFKAFMFQTMEEGEAVRITAKVTACVEKQDCALKFCSETTKNRRKRSDGNETASDEMTNENETRVANTTDFDRNLTVVVLTANRPDETWLERELLLLELEKQKSCPSFLISTVGLAAVLGLLIIMFFAYFIFQIHRKKKKDRSNWLRSSDRKSSRLWSSSFEVSPFSSQTGQSSVADDEKVTKSRLDFSNDFQSNSKKPYSPANNSVAVDPNPREDPPSRGHSLKRADSVLRSLQTFLAASVLSSLRPQAQSYYDNKRENTCGQHGCHCNKTKRCPSIKEYSCSNEQNHARSSVPSHHQQKVLNKDIPYHVSTIITPKPSPSNNAASRLTTFNAPKHSPNIAQEPQKTNTELPVKGSLRDNVLITIV